MQLARERQRQYVNDQAPWALLESDRERAGTVLYVCLRCVDNLKTMFTPFMPLQLAGLHELLGHEGWIAGPLEFREVEDEAATRTWSSPATTRAGSARWAPSELPPGQALREPKPLFRKLDPEKVEAEELARMEAAADEAA